MADYNRDGGRGGYQDRGGYNDRRRKRSDDMQYGGGYDSQKRQRYNDNRQDRGQYRDNYRGRDNYRDRDQYRSGDDDVLELRRRLISLGDSVNVNDSQAVRDVLSRCGDWLGEQLMFQAQEIAALVVTCAGRLSSKTEWYGMLTTLLNEKNSVFGKKVVELALESIQTDLTWWSTATDVAPNTIPVEFQRIKALVRFIGNLATTKMVLASDVVSLLGTLQRVCSTEAPRPVKDYFAQIVLDTILHCGHTLILASADPLEQLLANCQEFLSERESPDNSVSLVPSNNWILQRVRLNIICDPDEDQDMNTYAKSLDPVNITWQAVQTLIQATKDAPAPEEGALFHPQWQIQSLLYPLLNFLPVVKKTDPAPLPAVLTLPESFNEMKIPPYAIYTRILDDDSGPIGSAIGNMHLPSYVVARSYVEDIFEAFRPNPTETAKQLLATCRSLNGRWNLQSEYILIESLLVYILNGSHHSVAYGDAVLFHLLKNESKSIQSAFAILIELLFRRVPRMQMDVLDTFVRFFSLFLSNFEYKWPWAHWNHVLDAQADDAQRLFVSAVIERCVRLSYRQHMQSVLPEAFHMLLPPNPLHIIRFRNAESGDMNASISTTMHTTYETIFGKIKSREDPTSIQDWLENNAPNDLEKNILLEMIVSAVLDAGSATFTHFRSLLDKYMGLLNTLITDVPSGVVAISTVGNVWEQSPQHVTLLLNILMQAKVISPLAITTWLFCPDAVQQYSWPYVWEVLDNTVDYILSQCDEDAIRTLVFNVFEGFARVIATHKIQCDKEGTSFKDNWYSSTLARMRSFGRSIRPSMEKYLKQLENNIFSSEHAEYDIKLVFSQLSASFQ